MLKEEHKAQEEKASDGSFFESEDGADLNEINRFEEEEKSNGITAETTKFVRHKSD